MYLERFANYLQYMNVNQGGKQLHIWTRSLNDCTRIWEHTLKSVPEAIAEIFIMCNSEREGKNFISDCEVKQ